MNISVKGEYALQAIFDLASNPDAKNPVKIAEIARRQKIPQKFLELILASLKQGGFVESRRGAEGGYLLSKRRRSNHGRRGSSVCGRPAGRKITAAADKSDSPFAELWERVDQAMDSVLDATSLRATGTRMERKAQPFRTELGDLNVF